jgi:hypothetical protein
MLGMGDRAAPSPSEYAMNTIPSWWLGFLTSLVLVAVSGCTPKPIANEGTTPTADTSPAPVAVRKPTFRISGGPQSAVDVAGLSPEELAVLTTAEQTPDQWHALFAVYVKQRGSHLQQPPVNGSYRVLKDALRFEPKYPFMPGVSYRVVFHPERLPGNTGSTERSVEAVLSLPKPKTIATTIVEQVYPSADELPENLLKFYLHFSAPMNRGEAYEHIRLLRSDGKADERAFLDLPQELWDPDGKRLTLFLDPGRIKRGLKPREDLGPVLEAGGQYTLVIDSEWKDAKGNPLKEAYRKTFRVLPPEEAQPGPKTWTIEAPEEAGAASPFVMISRSPLDHALMQRMLWITDAKGTKVAGKVEVMQQEACWRFTPAMPWKSGRYYLVADTRLEDLAGNSIGQPFEVDAFQPIERERKADTVRVPFEVP